MNRIAELQQLIGVGQFSIWLLSSILLEIIFSCIDIFMCITLFRLKVSKMKLFEIIILDVFLRMVCYIFLTVPCYRACNLVITVVLFKVFFKLKIEKCVFAEVINAITVVVAEIIFSKICYIIFPNVDIYANGIYNFVYSFQRGLLLSLFRIAVLIIFIIKNIHFEICENLNRKNKISIIAVCVLGCVVIYFNALEVLLFISDFPYYIFIFNMFSLILYFYISVKNITRTNKLEEQHLLINNLETYNKTLLIMYDSIRGFRHDFSNFIQALDGYAEAGDVEEVKKMCRSILKDCKNVNNMGILDPNVINNPAIYSILTNKYYLSKSKNIEMNIEIMVDLKTININSYELCRILCILLDNAIDAAEKTSEKIINVRFVNDIKCKRKLIIIENSYKKMDVTIEKIFEKGYTTKEDSENAHGLGLWNVRRILAKSDNLNLHTVMGDLFCQQLEIYEKD